MRAATRAITDYLQNPKYEDLNPSKRVFYVFFENIHGLLGLVRIYLQFVTAKYIFGNLCKGCTLRRIIQ